MNEYDSSRMADQLHQSHGMIRTVDPLQADVLLLNTCSVREKAQAKVFSHLGRWRELKQANPDVIIGVGGCVASQEGEGILKRAPFVDLVFGPQTLHRLPELVRQAERTRKPSIDIEFPEIEKFDHLPPPKVDTVTAYVSIMEGCSKYCTFCIVPYTRGEEFSRPFDDVITEVVELADQGVREVTLLGQNVNGYRGLMHDGDEADLALLIRYVAQIEGIERIRFTTSHPVDFNAHLISVYADVPALVGHLHLPVQSGSDRILRQMKRRYSVDYYKNLVRELRTQREQLSLSSDFIVGFPGETDADFKATMELIHEVEFDQSFSFIYSARPGTPASDLADDVPYHVKQERLQILQGVVNTSAMAISKAMVGTTKSVLVDRTAKKDPGQLSGRTENNRVVNFDGPKQLIGHMVDVIVTEALPNSLRGRLLGCPPGLPENSVTTAAL